MTEKCGHTPGPWEAVRRKSSVLIATANLRREPIRKVAVVAIGTMDGEDVDRANARLIAAAPELLAAVNELLPTNLGAPLSVLDDELIVPVDMTIGEIRRARAAIARATTPTGLDRKGEGKS